MLSDSFLSKVIFLSVISSLFHLVCNQEPRIVNGYNVTSLTGFRHQVSLREVYYERIRYGSGHRCGGSLINNRTVVTAAHCVYGNKGFKPASTFIVTMGSLDRWVSDNNTLNILVRKVVGHKKYNEDTFEHDIALLILAAEVPSNHPTVQPISLASQNPLVGQTCTISGWGTTFYKGPEPSRLQAANVNINSRSECNQAHRYDGGVLSGMFCAGGFTGMNISDSCQGDSGGPLVCNGILTGITSNGFECALQNYPGIYINVYQYRNWIAENNSMTITGKIIVISSAFILSVFNKIRAF